MHVRVFSLFLILLACHFAFASENQDSTLSEKVSAENSQSLPGITEFQNHFLLRVLCNYNFQAIWTSEFDDGALISNRPVDLGLGIGYKDLYIDFIMALPFTTTKNRTKSLTFETGLDFFPGNWWIQAKYRRYSGFSTNKDSSTFVNLWQRDAYISALWMVTAHEQFTPRAAYFLDRIQNNSAGSFILGARIQDTKAKDRSETLEYYKDYREILSGWFDIGYSYTWVYSHGMFLNLWGIAGIAGGSDDLILWPEVIAKMAAGHIGEEWSWNVVLESEYMPVSFKDHFEQRLVCAFKLLVVRRF